MEKAGFQMKMFKISMDGTQFLAESWFYMSKIDPTEAEIGLL